MHEESKVVTALFTQKGRDSGGMLQNPLDVCTLLLHHSEIAIPGECSNQKAACYSLKKTITTTKINYVPKEEKKIVLLLGVSEYPRR